MSCWKEVTFLPDYEDGQGGGPSSANLKSCAFSVADFILLGVQEKFSLCPSEGSMRTISTTTHWVYLKSVVGSETFYPVYIPFWGEFPQKDYDIQFLI